MPGRGAPDHSDVMPRDPTELINQDLQHERLETALAALNATPHDAQAHHDATVTLVALHALEALRARRVAQRDLQLVLDVAATADHGTTGLSPIALAVIGVLTRHGVLHDVNCPGVILTPAETRQAGRVLRACFTAAPVSPHEAAGTLQDLLSHPDDALVQADVRPHEQKIQDITIHEDNRREEQLGPLRALQAQAQTEEGQAAAALARVAVSRAQYRDLNVPLLLTTAEGLTDLAERAGESRTVTRAISRHVWAAARELQVRMPHHPRPGLSAPPHVRPTLLPTARHALRRAQSEHTAPPRDLFTGSALWRLFEELDITSGIDLTPEQREQDWVIQQFATIETLLHHRRAPGMALQDLTEIAAALSGYPGDWAWTYQPFTLLLEGITHGNLSASLLTLTRIDHGHWLATQLHEGQHDLPPLPALPPEYHEFRQAVITMCGQTLAGLNARGYRAPEHTRLTEALGRMGSFPQAALPPQAYTDVMSRLAFEDERLLDHIDALITHVTDVVDMLDERESLEAQGGGDEAPIPAGTGAAATPAGEGHAAPERKRAMRQEPAHVREARTLLTGREVVMLGGTVKASHQENLERTLGLTLHWHAGDAYVHGTHLPIPHATALIILPVRFMSHGHFWGLKDAAARSGIPFVIHPGGLNPNSIASSVMDQCSDRLRVLA